MELVGRTREVNNVDGGLVVIFQCCNQEVFDLLMSPALGPLPIGEIIRVQTNRVDVTEILGVEGPSEVLEVIVHWEDMK